VSAPEQLLGELSRRGIELWAEGERLNYRAAPGRMSAELKQQLREQKSGLLEALRRREGAIVPDLEHRYDPFPLTETQQAYWLGRDTAYELGNVAAHSYVECDLENLDLARLERAVNRLIERHEMLRAVVGADGNQRILPTVPQYRIQVSRENAEAIRERMSHQVLPADRWPLFAIEASLIPGGRTRLHVSLDLLIADAGSVLLLARECVELYEHPEAAAPPINLSFRDYVLADAAWRRHDPEAWNRSLEWWRARLPNLPGPPELPLAIEPSQVKRPRFVRRSGRMEPGAWERVKARARACGATPSILLCTAYAEVLGLWSKEQRFTLNLTLFNRLPRHADVERLAGDFTSGVLLEVDCTAPQPFGARAGALQERLWQDVEHSRVGSVRVLREMARIHGAGRATMPVVFTSLLQAGVDSTRDWSRYVHFGVSQTPQVWLDHQVFELGGALVFNWDAVEELFPPGLLDDLFNAYTRLLAELGHDEAWTRSDHKLLPRYQAERRTRVNATSAPVRDARLEELFIESADRYSERPAVITAERTLTYRELERRSARIARRLQELEVRPGELVAVVSRKGWEQAVAVLGILRAGAAYVPLDAGLPVERLARLLDRSKVRVVLTQSTVETGGESIAVDQEPEESPGIYPAKPAADQLAYVIYTSGSTGQPKGVMISHGGAVNTITDINRRFAVGPDDRVLGLSSLSFDLSVYDLFGLFTAGGTLVLPEAGESRDPLRWAELITRERVTIWNSVPALMEMLVESLKMRGERLPASLRLILLSGDWIPPSLPGRLSALHPDIRVVSLGGATEGSIWSILYPIEQIDLHWNSVPYGRPMDNQRFYVRNTRHEDCPDWVPGELYIGGMGVAQGYWGDEEKTRASFVHDPETGERLYRTGDLGRYLPDGNIEFLGREDGQVKVQGHRIELGEIESALRQHPLVREAVVTAPGPREHRRLEAFVVAANVPDSGGASVPIRPDAMLDPEELGRIRSFTALLEQASTLAICATLREMGLFGAAGERRTIAEIARRFDGTEPLESVLAHWLAALVADGLLLDEGESCYSSGAALPCQIPGEIWKALETHPCADSKLLAYFRNSFQAHKGLLEGRTNPLELLFPEGSWSTAEKLYAENPAAAYLNGLAARVMANWAGSRTDDLRILEVGAGIGSATASLLEVLPAGRIAYTFTDISPFFRSGARRKFAAWPQMTFGLLDINKDAGAQGFSAGSFDAIVAANVLHGARDLHQTLVNLRQLLAAGGVFLLLEGTTYPRYLMASATGFLEGLGVAPDSGQKRGGPLLSLAQWNQEFERAGFTPVIALPEPNAPESALGLEAILCTTGAASRRATISAADLREFLRGKLPDYMIPGSFTVLDALPLSSNGKVDRAALAASTQTVLPQPTEDVMPASELEQKLIAIWKELLNVTAVGLGANFFELGGDSLIAVQLNGRLKKDLGIELPLRAIFDNACVRDLAAAIAKQGRTALESEMPEITPDPAHRYDQFPLTEVQQAYWIGRMGPFELGNVPCQVYLEFEAADWDLERLAHAWQSLIDRHEMLRAEFLPAGTQRIMESAAPFELKVVDLRGLEQEVAEAQLGHIREEMAYAKGDVRRWPLFDIRATRIAGQLTRLHVSIEALIADGWSLFCLFRDWNYLYHSAEPLPPLELSFRDYVMAQAEVVKSGNYRKSQEYWQKRLEDFPEAPKLPLAANPESIGNPRFRRRTERLGEGDWVRFCEMARQLGLTPSNALLAAYAETLANWSANGRFTLNVTQFNRLPLHRQVNNVVGDFTSLLLVEIDCGATAPFAERARRVQTQLANDMDHAHAGGVPMIRQLARRAGGPRALMPVVFTSMLSFGSLELSPDGLPNIFGKPVFSVSQTPQVWLDHQAWEEDRRLVLSWDAIEELFPGGMLDVMFAAYTRLIRRLATQDAAWMEAVPVLTPERDLEIQKSANRTAVPKPDECLHTLVKAQVERQPERQAVVAADRTLTYEELWRMAEGLGCVLRDRGARPDSHVAIFMDKGWEQVVGVLATLLAGAAYLPIDPALPAERVRHLLAHAEARLIVTHAHYRDRPELRGGAPVFTVADSEAGPLDLVDRPDALAYTIYTSGSTGLPKGVAIEHRGAVNTIVDINRRFRIGPNDRVLALSSLSFDLSVWDIFGTLAAGGTIVMPPASARRDPAQWLDLLERERIRIWNSVPALMRMLLAYRRERKGRQSQDLRLAMLSGDWIPVSLAGEIREFAPGAEVVSLGGATEASIWSIVYPIGEVEPAWSSIPYGKPLANQCFHVLDERMRPRPVWARGMLYIGGSGLAREYWRDPDKTGASFVLHPETGERLYRTGDMGRYLSDGNIEFLGREDVQVKVQGYRVELGEIEAALEAHPQIRAAAVVAIGEARGDKRLVAFVVPMVQAGAAERLELKLRHVNLRQDRNGRPVVTLSPPGDDVAAFLSRRTHRRFAAEPVSADQLSHLLAALRQMQPGDSLFAKRRYASAGDLYAVQVYVHVKAGRVAGLRGGAYYYFDPMEHQLVQLSEGDADPEMHLAPNRSIFDDAAFSIHLVGEMQAIEQLYGPLARDFCLLEAGAMSQLLMTVAAETGLGLCPVGAVNFEYLHDPLALNGSQVHLHTLLGGCIETRNGDAPYQPSMPRIAERAALDALFADELRRWVRGRLPEYMTPSAFVMKSELPLTANGKVDRKALARESVEPVRSARFEAPQTDLERTIAAVLGEALHKEAVGLHDNFFELGATSIELVQIGGTLGRRLGREIPVVELFTHSTIETLARCLIDSESANQSVAHAAKERASKQRAALDRQRTKRGR
jgi:yersiniabactin nonribosomal peptide synthetase